MAESQPRASRDDWDAHWDHYAESAGGKSRATDAARDHRAIALRQDAGKGAMRIFDLGSGQGDLVAETRNRCCRMRSFVGAELSESGVEISRRKVPGRDVFRGRYFSTAGGTELNLPVGRRTRFVPKSWSTSTIRWNSCEKPANLSGAGRAFDRDSSWRTDVGFRSPHRSSPAFRPPENLFDARAGRLLGRTDLSCRVSRFLIFTGFLSSPAAKRLAQDVESKPGAASSGLAGFAMKVFRVLFHANLLDSPFGWQVIATARKNPA